MKHKDYKLLIISVLNNKINAKENMTQLYEMRRENCKGPYSNYGQCDDGRTEYNYYLNYVFHCSRVYHRNIY